MSKIRAMPPEQMAKSAFKFTDNRLPEMLFRYRARNYPETLSADELQSWNVFCANRLTGRQDGSGIVLDDYFNRLDELRRDENVSSEIINALEDYALERMHMLGMKQARVA